MKLLLDTNVVLDLLLHRPPYEDDVKKLCIGAEFGDLQLWVNLQSFTDAFYIMQNYYSRADIKRDILHSLEYFKPFASNASDLKHALESDWVDIEGYLIAHSARLANIDYVISRDKEVLEKSPTSTFTPSGFLAHLKNSEGIVYSEADL